MPPVNREPSELAIEPQERPRRPRLDVWAAGLGVALLNRTARWPAWARRHVARVVGDLAWGLVGLAPARHAGEPESVFPRARRGGAAPTGATHVPQPGACHDRSFGALERQPQDIERLVRMDGMKQVADPTNRPLILLAPHFIGLDAGGVRLTLDIQIVSIYARQSNPVWTAGWRTAARASFLRG